LAPAGVDVVTVCDREADIYEMFALAQEKEAKLLVRASTDRSLADDEVSKLWEKVEQQAIAGHLTIQITKNQKQEARQVTVSVRFTQVKLKPPWRPNKKKLPMVTLNAILVREENPPDDVDDPIEWLQFNLLVANPIPALLSNKLAMSASLFFCLKVELAGRISSQKSFSNLLCTEFFYVELRRYSDTFG